MLPTVASVFFKRGVDDSVSIACPPLRSAPFTVCMKLHVALQTCFVPSPHNLPCVAGFSRLVHIKLSLLIQRQEQIPVAPFHSPGNLAGRVDPHTPSRSRTDTAHHPWCLLVQWSFHPGFCPHLGEEGWANFAIDILYHWRLGHLSLRHMWNERKGKQRKIEITRLLILGNYIYACLPSQSSFEAKILFNSVFSVSEQYLLVHNRCSNIWCICMNKELELVVQGINCLVF